MVRTITKPLQLASPVTVRPGVDVVGLDAFYDDPILVVGGTLCTLEDVHRADWETESPPRFTDAQEEKIMDAVKELRTR